MASLADEPWFWCVVALQIALLAAATACALRYEKSAWEMAANLLIPTQLQPTWMRTTPKRNPPKRRPPAKAH